MHAADIFASIVILFPILWAIRHIQRAQEADRDEKTKDTLVRLTQFRTFYMLTMAWLYFTRIIVYLLESIVAYDRLWVAELANEVATLAYYSWVGYRFRPAADNSDYLRVPTDDDGPPSAIAGGAEVELASAHPASAVVIDDAPDAKSTATSSRVVVPTQTASKASSTTAPGETTTAGASLSAAAGGATAPAAPGSRAAGGGRAGKAIAIADDDREEDDFDVDDDDFEYAKGGAHGHAASSGAGAGAGAGGLRNVRAAKHDADDDLE